MNLFLCHFFILLFCSSININSAPRTEIEPVVLPDENFSSISVQDELITKKLEVTERAIICKEAYLCNVTIGDNLLIEGDLTVDGSTNLSGVIISGNTTLDSLTVIGNTNLNDLTVTGNTSLNDLTASGNTTLADLTVTGDALISNESVTGNLTVDGTLSLGSPLDLSSLSITNDADIGCNLTVGCNIFTQNTNATIGAYYKGGLLWLHNRGTNNTFLGINAGNLTLSGTNNIGIGDSSLIGLQGGSNNTAIGQGTLPVVNSGSNNTALGRGALPLVDAGSNNIAIGNGAGGTLRAGNSNIYIGASAVIAGESLAIRIGTSQGRNFQAGIRGGVASMNLDTAVVSIDSANQLGTGRIYNDIDLADTTATQGAILKSGTLWLHDSGSNSNTFLGLSAGNRTLSGFNNTGIGASTLAGLSTGINNTAIGNQSLIFIDLGNANTAIGSGALVNLQTGAGNDGNIAVGHIAGINLLNGGNNIYIGNSGMSNETGIVRIGTTGGTHTSCLIAGSVGVEGQVLIPNMASSIVGLGVEITSSGQLVSLTSSQKFKKNIKPLTDQATQNFMQLQPVSFNFTHDTAQNPQTQYGFIAEDVNKTMPELVVCDEQGEPLGINFKSMYALLLKLIQDQQMEINRLKESDNQKIAALNLLIQSLVSRIIALETINQ